MTDLVFLSGETNLGGNYSIRFVPVAGIDSMPLPATTGATTPPTFKAGFRWFDMYGTEGTKSYEEKEDRGDNGPVWSVTVSLFLPGDTADRRAQLAELMRHRFIVEIEDNNGLRRRVGSQIESLELNYTFKTGGQLGDRKGAQLSFSGSLTKPAAIITY